MSLGVPFFRPGPGAQPESEPIAKIIADSISPDGSRLTTMQVRIWRPTLAEFNTHRAFSRNSASSRAIPVHKRIEEVREHTAMPISWPAEQKGMQGGDELDARTIQLAQWEWTEAACEAADRAERLVELGIHKSVVNRLLEPFIMHTVVVSSTEWDNFFKQRCSPLAQPEIRIAAEAMEEALNFSQPMIVGYGQWHLPYYDDGEICVDSSHVPAQISAARCARVSYLTQEGKKDHEEDLKLYARLVSADPPHASPLEHVATPFEPQWGMAHANIEQKPVLGNFQGWRQLRHEVFA